MRVNDTSSSVNGQWILVSKFDSSAAGASYWNNNISGAAVVLKTSGKQNGYVDNIKIWTGLGDEPSDTSSLLKSDAAKKCDCHVITASNCSSTEHCKYCSYDTEYLVEHTYNSSNVCTQCGKTQTSIESG